MPMGLRNCRDDGCNTIVKADRTQKVAPADIKTHCFAQLTGIWAMLLDEALKLLLVGLVHLRGLPTVAFMRRYTVITSNQSGLAV